MNKNRLKNYAKLIAKSGVNVQKGQDVIISCELDQPEFIKMLVDECYKAGARLVRVEWSYQDLAKLHYKHAKESVLEKFEKWEIEKLNHQVETLPCRIYILSEDPDGLSGINLKKFAKVNSARAKTIKPIRQKMENKYQWCIAAVPSVKWAKKLFPDKRASVAVEMLWEAILKASRVDEDPIKAWENHNNNLSHRCDYLNSLKIKELYYSASNGTNLRVGLIPEAQFCAGGERTQSTGYYFNPNIPTEETFTSPKKGDADGIVYSSMPLSYQGQLIENFYFEFEGGKIVKAGAEKNEELLKEMINIDEGAKYLGECALVPYSSPIRESGILFYNTLFDENAACHLAIGRGFTNLISDYEKYTDEQLHEMGINDSATHVDFMIGTKDLSIKAKCEDGRIVDIFKDGEWAF